MRLRDEASATRRANVRSLSVVAAAVPARRDDRGITLGRRIYVERADAERRSTRCSGTSWCMSGRSRELGLLALLWRYIAEYVENRRRGLTSRRTRIAASPSRSRRSRRKTSKPYNRRSPHPDDPIPLARNPAARTLSRAPQGGAVAQERHRSRSRPAPDPAEGERVRAVGVGLDPARRSVPQSGRRAARTSWSSSPPSATPAAT